MISMYEQVANTLKQKEWKVRKTTGDKYSPDGIVLSASKGRALLVIVLHDEHNIDIGGKNFYRPPSYLISHQQNVFKGEITYEHNLETQTDYEDFMSYVNYHYDNLTGF